MDTERKQELTEAHKGGLTSAKIASDRMAAFEVGTEVFIEKVGMDDTTAEQFRGVMQEGLDELQANPEMVKQALDAAGV